MGVTLAAASSFSSLSISAAALALGCFVARSQLIALTGVELGAISDFSSPYISVAAFPLGMGNAGCCSAHAADRPARQDARGCQQLQLVLHLGRCDRSRPGQNTLLLGAYTADRPDGRHARHRQRLRLTFHLSRCFCSWLEQHGLLLGALTADRPDGRDARRHQRFWLALRSGRCFPFRNGQPARRKQLIALPGMMLAAASGFSSLSISAAAFVLGWGSTGCCSAQAAARPAGHDARRGSGSSSLSSSAAAFALGLGSTGCCSARTQLIAQTGVTLAATSGYSSLSIWAADFALGKSGTGCCSARAQPIARMGTTLADASGFRLQTLADASGFRFRLRAEQGPTRQAPALSGPLTYHGRRDATSPCAPRAQARRCMPSMGPPGTIPAPSPVSRSALRNRAPRSSCDSEQGPAGRDPGAQPQSHQSR